MCLGFFFLFLSSWECIVLFAEVHVWEWACESNDNWRAAFVKHSQGVVLSGLTSFVPLTGNIRASAVLCPCRKYCQGFCLTNTHTGTCLQHAGAVICTSLLTQCSRIATFGGNAWTRSLPIFLLDPLFLLLSCEHSTLLLSCVFWMSGLCKMSFKSEI